MTTEWKKCVLKSSESILTAMNVLNNVYFQIVLILDNDGKLLGTITDGDIRRGLLKGVRTTDSISKVMNSSPYTVCLGESRLSILNLMKEKLLHQLPVINDKGIVVGLEVLDDIIKQNTYDNSVLIMAGGYGSRLKELTEDTPKPLLRIGPRPILETILMQFIEHGFNNFIISLMYKGELIKEYFQDGSKLGCKIDYIVEDKPLGTAGALSQLKEKPTRPVFVMNGDILTKINFSALLDFHQKNKSVATMCVREFEHVIPYGVVDLKDTRVLSIQEKPTIKSMVNAGIYMLEPECIDYVPKNSYFDMPSLFRVLINHKKVTSVFPIHEYWIDIGQHSEFQRAEEEYETYLGKTASNAA